MILIVAGEPTRYAALERALKSEGAEVTRDIEVDLGSMQSVRASVERARPKAVVMGLGMTDRAACEADTERAYIRNAESAIHLAAAAREFGATPVWLSSAEVFGLGGGPFIESDTPSPVSVLGESAKRGEDFLLRAAPNGLVLRSGPVVEDVNGGVLPPPGMSISPVCARALAVALVTLLKEDQRGIVHVASGEPVLATDFMERISKAAKPKAPGSEHSTDLSIDPPADTRPVPRSASANYDLWPRSPTLVADRLRRFLTAPLPIWTSALRAPDTETRALMLGEQDPSVFDEVATETVVPDLDSLSIIGPRSVERSEQTIPIQNSSGPQPELLRPSESSFGQETTVFESSADLRAVSMLHMNAGARLERPEKTDAIYFVVRGKVLIEISNEGDGDTLDVVLKPNMRLSVGVYAHALVAVVQSEVLSVKAARL